MSEELPALQERGGEAGERPATVRDYMYLADVMTTRRLAYEKPGQDTPEMWLAYRSARYALKAALVSGVVDAAAIRKGETP